MLYLGRPKDSVTVEAYRHLVDASEGMRPELVAPRRLFECSVSVSNILDLRDPEAQMAVGLDREDLLSEVGEYEACHGIARVAHQLAVHGIVAPSATGLGETLALFTNHLPAAEMPDIIGEQVWQGLPADPRRLRAVEDDSA